MSKSNKRVRQRWTRRKFLSHVGMVGGAAALYETMVAMNLVHIPDQNSGPIQFQPGRGAGQSVVILGAGIGGLTTAYLMHKEGYDVTILESSNRLGGRSLTGRKGDKVVENHPTEGKIVSTVNIDEDQYINLGPGRLPYHHRRVLRYCKELGVQLEPYIMNTTGNLFQTEKAFDGKPVVYREIQNDTRGYIAELLAKVTNQGALDQELNAEDREKLLGLLQQFGSLAAQPNKYGSRTDYIYEGSTRDGCADDPDGQPTPNVYYNCQNPKDLVLNDLLEAEFWDHRFYSPMEFEWQATLFQPVGGMDMIVKGFERALEGKVKILKNAPVNGIEVTDRNVTVRYGRQGKVTADFCVSNIPCPILHRIKNNFTKDFAKAVQRTTFDPSCKVGWQAEERFWEDNENEIYGGISWTDDQIEQIWYPSNGYFGKKGTLTGAYMHDENAARFGKLPVKERLAQAKKGAAKLHKEFLNDRIVPTDKGITIAWQYVEHQEGAWPSWVGNQHDQQDYQRILLPDRRFYIVGDQASTLPGWQEGAMMSAEHVFDLIRGEKEAVVPEAVMAPNTKRVVQGIRATY